MHASRRASHKKTIEIRNVGTAASEHTMIAPESTSTLRELDKHVLPAFEDLLSKDVTEGGALVVDWVRVLSGRPPKQADSPLCSCYWLGSECASPNHENALLSKRVMAQIRSPVRVST